MNEWLKGQKTLSRKQLMKMAEEWLKTPPETQLKTVKTDLAGSCNLASTIASIVKARKLRGLPKAETLADLVEQWQEVNPQECLRKRKTNELMQLAEDCWELYLDEMETVNSLRAKGKDPQYLMEMENNAVRLITMEPELEPEEEQETEEETEEETDY